MKVHIATLPFDPELGRFDDEPVRNFLADKELLDVRDHFFVYQGKPHLAVLLTYDTGIVPVHRPKVTKGEKSGRRDAWRELLEPPDWPLFNTLREWRGQRAKAEGIPPYVISTNRQLALLVRARPQSLNSLGEIEGFGTNKLKSYGKEILALILGTVEEWARAVSEEEPGTDDRDD